MGVRAAHGGFFPPESDGWKAVCRGTVFAKCERIKIKYLNHNQIGTV